MKPYFAMPADGWYNIAIAGEFPHSTGYVQVLDGEAFKAIVQDVHEQQGKPNWPGILIDFDHGSLDVDKPSTAAGWLTDIEERPDGLWAQIRWSDCGQRSLEGGEFRFVSPVWMLADCEELGEKRVRPRRIASCAITNAPNIRGMVPLTNRAEEKGVPLSPTGRALPIQERVQVPRAALEAIEKLENRALTDKQRKLLWARNGQWYGGNGGSPYQNAAKAGREAAAKEGATPDDIIKAKKEARDQSKLMHDYLKRKANPEIREKERQRRQEKTIILPGKKIKRIKKATSGDVTWEKKDSGFKKYGRKLKRGRALSADPKARSDSRADEALRRLGLLNRARLAAFLANTSWDDMTDQQRRWWWAQMGGGGSAVNPYTGEAPTSADNPWATEGTPSNPYAQLYGADMSPEESAFWRVVYGNADDPNWTPSEDFGTTSDVDGLFSPEGWAAHQQLSQDLNQQLRDEYDRIARQEAIDYQNNLPAFTAPSTWDYFSAAVEDFGRGMAYGVGNLIDAIADIPQTTITGIPDLAALIAKGGSWLVGGSGNVAEKMQTFADAVHDFVDPKAQWAKDKLGLSQMIDELGRNYSGSDWAAKTSKVSATVFAAAVDMLVGLGGLAYGKGPEGIVKLGGTLNDATKIELGLATKEQILAKDILGAIRNLNIENVTKGIDADVLRKFAKQDLDDAVRHLDEALDLNRAMSAERKMNEMREIERRWAQLDYDRARIPAQEADNALEAARYEQKLAKERAAQEWYESNILKADREAEAARLANPHADAEARQLARENPASLGTPPAAKAETATERAARLKKAEKAEREAQERAMGAMDDFIKRRAESGWTWEDKHIQEYAYQWNMSFEDAKTAYKNIFARKDAEKKVMEQMGVTKGTMTKAQFDDFIEKVNLELGYAGEGKSIAFKLDDPKAASFAERNPKWVKVTNPDGTVHFEQPASNLAPTRANLDDAVSRLNTPTKNEIVGGMYDAASRGGSYSDDAGRLLVDNGTVTPAGERMIKEGAREQMGAGRAATEASSTTARSGLSRETILKDMESAQARGSTYRVDMDSPLVENGKLTARGKAFMAEGTPANPRKKLEEAAESIRRADAAEDAARATRGALDDAMGSVKATPTATPTTGALDDAIESFTKTQEDMVIRQAAYERLNASASTITDLKGRALQHIEDGTNFRNPDGNFVVKDGKLTKLGEACFPELKGQVPSTTETGVVRIVKSKITGEGNTVAASVTPDNGMAALRTEASSYKAPQAPLTDAQRNFIQTKGRFGEEDSIEAYNLLVDAGYSPRSAAQMVTKGNDSLESLKVTAAGQRANKAKQAQFLEEAHQAQAARLAEKEREATRQKMKAAIDNLFEPLNKGLEQPSVTRTARAIDALEENGLKEAGRADWKTIAGIGMAGSVLSALPFMDFSAFKEGPRYVVVPENATTRSQSLTSPPKQLDVPVAPDGTVLWYHVNDRERDKSQNPEPVAPIRVQDESGALLDAKGRVRGFAEGTEAQSEETGYDWASMGIEGNRTPADNKPHLMDAIRASAPGVSELREALAAVEPQYVKIERENPPAEPTAEQVEMVRQNAGVTAKQNAESLKIRIDQLEQERADLQARTYAVPVPEMRPTEYQNIQQVRAAAAAQPGATSTSIIAAVNKAQKQNSDVSKLKAELGRAASGARTDKQREKATDEVLRRFNADYYDAVEKNQANDKNAAKRLAKIESQLDTLNRAYGYAQERAKNAEDRAEEKLRNQTRRESEKAERKQEREQREADRKARYEASIKVKALKAGIRSLERQTVSEYNHNRDVWRVVMDGVTEGKGEYRRAALELEPRLDWNAALSLMRGVYGSTRGARDRKTGRPLIEKERRGLAKGQVFGIELPLLEEVAG